MILLALVLSLTVSVPAFASEDSETFTIDGYTCYEKGGNYCTLIDGEEYIVISINEEDLIADMNPMSTRALGSTWPNSATADISDGSTYEGSGDITDSDHYSPMITVARKNGDVSIAIHMGFVFSNSYDITVAYYLGYGYDIWSDQPQRTFTFNLTGQTRLLLTGTISQNIEKIGLLFSKDSTGEKEFGYSIYQP